ncbi:MAG TPA: hypothetical protein VI316_04520 [Candidatus Dormibacteraeota bacterium]
MGARHLRFLLAAVAVALVTLPSPVVRAYAGTCGDDSSPPCPLGQTVVPNVVSAPVQDATIEVRGSSLADVASANLQPGGASLSIIARTPSSLTLRLPDGLGAGSYQIQMALPGQTQGFAVTPFFEVAGVAAGATLPHFSFAPAPAVGQASATAAVPPPARPVVAAKPMTSVATNLLQWAILVLAVGVLGGGVITLAHAALRRRREVRLRDITYAAMDRRLKELWALGDQRTAPVSRPPDREASPARRY